MKWICYALTILLFLAHSPVGAQVSNEEIDAFSESYVHEENGNYAEARSELVKVYREKSYELNLRLGWLYYKEGNQARSKTMYERAMKIMPYSIEAKLGYALPLSALGNWTEVISTYQEVLKIDPQNSLVNYRLGSIYYERKEYSKALKHLEKVANMYPFDYDTIILFAWTKFQMGKLREAQVLFRKALLIRPGDDSAREGLNMIK